MSEPGEITQLLQQADQGSVQAANQLFLLVQEELKAIAKKRKKQFAAGLDMCTTAIVDEAFCRLVGQDATTWNPGDRRKFFQYAATKIHNLLVDLAKAAGRKRRGGDRQRAEGEAWDIAAPVAGSLEDSQLLMDLQSALEKFDGFALDEAILFRLRFFLGCTFEEMAEIMNVSATKAKDGFKKAQVWLQRELKGYCSED